MRALAVGMMVIGLGGCATYRPAPLPSVAEIVGAPWTVTSGPVSHPRLVPAPIDPRQPLDDLGLARLALVTSPDLAAARARVGVADAQLVAAGLLPDPQLSLAIDRPWQSGLVDAVTAGLTFDLAALVTRQPRQAAARASREQVRADVAWTEWLALNQVRTLVRRLQSLDGQIATAHAAESAAQSLYDTMQRAMTRGDARVDDVSVYEVGLLDAQDRRLALVRQRVATRAELNAALGVPPDAALALAVPGPLRPLPSLDAMALMRRAGEARLDLAALRAGYAAQDHTLRVATRASLPLPQLGLSVARDTGGVRTRGLSVGLSVPLWNRGRGEIRIADATRNQLAAEYRARVLQTRGDIAAQIGALRAIDVERRALLDRLPTLERTVAILERGARAGDVPAATYESVRAAWLDKTLAAQALDQAQREAEVALETAVGEFVWTTR